MRYLVKRQVLEENERIIELRSLITKPSKLQGTNDRLLDVRADLLEHNNRRSTIMSPSHSHRRTKRIGLIDIRRLCPGLDRINEQHLTLWWGKLPDNLFDLGLQKLNVHADLLRRRLTCGISRGRRPSAAYRG